MFEIGKSTLLVIYLLITTCLMRSESFAQSDTIRFKNQVFERTVMRTVTYLEKSNEKLQMDIYQPEGDTKVSRPMVLYVHGGGFSGGDRAHPNHVAFCKELAKKGYVTASMSYSLVRKGKSFNCDTQASDKIETFKLAANDIASATKYLLEHQQELGISTKQIVIAGSSAGAEGVLHAAYWNVGRKIDNVNILPEGFRFGGVISMAGALIDEKFITSHSAIPSQFFHGTCDNLVPYGTASHHYCDYGKSGYLTIYGGKSLADRLQILNKGYYLVTGCDGAHEWNDLPIRSHTDLITDFLYYDVIQGQFRQIHTVKFKEDSTCNIKVAELPTQCH